MQKYVLTDQTQNTEKLRPKKEQDFKKVLKAMQKEKYEQKMNIEMNMKIRESVLPSNPLEDW